MSEPLTKQELENIIQISINKALEPIKEDIRKIELYLYDDTHTNTPGVVQRLRKAENDISKIKEDKRVEKKVHASLGAIGGIVLTGIIELLKYFFSK